MYHWTSSPKLFKPILLLRTEKENTQNCQIMIFGLKTQKSITQFRLTFSFSLTPKSLENKKLWRVDKNGNKHKEESRIKAESI